MRIRRMLGSQAERDVFLRTEQAVTSKLPNSQIRSGQRAYIAFGNLDIIISGFHLVVSVEDRGQKAGEEGDQIQHKEVSFYLKPLTSNT